MNLEFGTRAIIALAWARDFGVDDSALQPDRTPVRLFVPAVGTDMVQVLHLGDHQVVRAPGELLPLLRTAPDEHFMDDRALVSLLHGSGLAPSVRSLGVDALTYVDAPFEIVGSEHVSVSGTRTDLARLLERSPHDDASTTTLQGCDRCFVLFSEAHEEPVAAASYWAPGGLLADTTVLTYPAMRGYGLGKYAAALAVDDALSEGLIPQARIKDGQDAASALATSLGFELVGSLLSVRLHNGL
ncbi:GNAT family N-acetyltransferase [Paeniglutamicibacter sp. NPDC012692]|uniref:GNAT family N-acetyltransferase n=1 Tax=Paeniglutamicibacter sp. NPDC012692 TaxID=3364388 RepID=UPI0036869A7F